MSDEQRTALYRFYDAHEALLYVGITDDPWRRQRQHMREKPWYPQVRHQSVTWYDSERLARRAEGRAIRTEKPLFNVAGALRPPRARFQVRLSAVVLGCCGWMLVPSLLFVCVGLFTRQVWPVLNVLILSTLVPMTVLPLVAGAPWLCRFACWLTRNFRCPDPGSEA